MNTLNGIIFKEMLQSGAANLNNKHAEIDALNVFPVPDGDTGTNMLMTFTSGVKDACNTYSDDLSVLTKTLSKGLLMGARGNSGVITSQIFRGFYQYLEGKNEITVKELAEAFENGARVAYKAVMRPVEGTILTVIRESSWYANKYVEENPNISVEEYFDKLIVFAKDSLEHTPDLLPVLKEVGVVDSGGAGLVTIFEGFKSYLDGNPIKASENTEEVSSNLSNVESEEYGYCTEFIIRLSDNNINTFKEERLKKTLAALGNSLVVVQDEELVKVHVHTLTPGDALNAAQRYGEFVKLKIENMSEQHDTIVANNNSIVGVDDSKLAEEEKDYALITVAAGEGLTNLFKEYRCDVVISGGQTMNPSTEDFVEAIKKLKAKHIFILPNNSNIILAAKQAQLILEDQDVRVIESKTLPEGLSACIMFNPEVDADTNEEEMKEAVQRVTTGQVTYAIKDTSFEGLEIHEGDYMGMFGKKIIVAVPDKMKAIYSLLDEMMKNEDAEIMTVIAGEDTTDEEIAEVCNYIEEHSSLEVDCQKGDQPVYCYVFGIE